MVLVRCEHLVGGRRPPEDHRVAEGDAPGVLHRPGVELGHEDLVVLPERVPDAEQPVVVVEADPGRLQHVLGLLAQVRLERAPRVHPQRDAVVLGPHRRPRPRAHRDEVRGQRGRRGQLGAAGRDEGGTAVAEHRPLLRSGDRDGVGRLEVGLVEAGEHRRGGVEEQVAVDVVLAVGGVGAAVQALPVVAVGHRRLDLEHVVGLEVGEVEPAVDQGCRVQRPSVEGHRVQHARPDLDEGVGPRCAAGEPQLRARAEHLRPPVEVEVDLHGVEGEEGGPGEGLGAGQGRHPPTQPETPRPRTGLTRAEVRSVPPDQEGFAVSGPYTTLTRRSAPDFAGVRAVRNGPVTGRSRGLRILS